MIIRSHKPYKQINKPTVRIGCLINISSNKFVEIITLLDFLKEVFRFHDFGHLLAFAVIDFLEPKVTQHTKDATLQQQVPVKEETERFAEHSDI